MVWRDEKRRGPWPMAHGLARINRSGYDWLACHIVSPRVTRGQAILILLIFYENLLTSSPPAPIAFGSISHASHQQRPISNSEAA